jgi:hypothetical protein
LNGLYILAVDWFCWLMVGIGHFGHLV